MIVFKYSPNKEPDMVSCYPEPTHWTAAAAAPGSPWGSGAETAGRLSYQNKRREASLERGSADNSIRMCGCACVCVCVSQTCMYIHIYIYGDNIHVSWSD